MVGLKFDLLEEQPFLLLDGQSIIDQDGTPVSNKRFDEQDWEVDRVYNPNAPLGKAVVFHDSFGVYWAPFLGRYFRETVYVGTPEFDIKFIEQEKPEFVIHEMVERRLFKDRVGWRSKLGAQN